MGLLELRMYRYGQAMPDQNVDQPVLMSMKERGAGQSVIEELYRLQSAASARSVFDRIVGNSPLLSDAKAWYTGALGEIEVGRILADLPAGWSSYRALPIGTRGSDIDHVVVGPGGVFTINTKHHRGKNIWVGGKGFLVSGQRQHYISNAESEADKVTRMLRTHLPDLPAVIPVIALVKPKQITIKVKPDRVAVLDAGYLPRFFRKRKPLLTEAELEILNHLVDSPTFWRADPRVQGAEARAHFAQLHRDVRNAGMARIGWKVAGFVTLVLLIRPTFDLALSLLGTH